MSDRNLAAMLAADGGEGMEDVGGEFPEEASDEADEGQLVAAEEMLMAFEGRDAKSFMDALRSFIRMTN